MHQAGIHNALQPFRRPWACTGAAMHAAPPVWHRWPLAWSAGALAPAPAPLLQAALADFIGTGDFATHIGRMRTLYAKRRAASAAALGDRFGDRLRIELQAGGMHLLAWPRAKERDTELVARAGSICPSLLNLWLARPRDVLSGEDWRLTYRKCGTPTKYRCGCKCQQRPGPLLAASMTPR
jgi:hypothetical protein